MTVRITNIQHFSLHDGPGIRTTVFLKGCPINCPWCANPECISPEIEGEFGYEISLENLEKEILKDKPFYETGGGVTFSGGEPLLQVKKLEPLLKSLKKQDIHICFETSLFVPEKYLKIANEYCDEFIVDIKILNNEKCKNILNGNISQYINNLPMLDLNRTTFRIPLNEFTLTKENIDLISKLLKNYKAKKLEIFKIHNLARRKYKILNKEFYYKEVSNKDIQEVYNKFKKIIPHTEIIEI